MLQVSAHRRRAIQRTENGAGLQQAIMTNRMKGRGEGSQDIACFQGAEDEEEWKVRTMWRISATPSL